MNVRYLEIAKIELKEAVSYYNNHRMGLGGAGYYETLILLRIYSISTFLVSLMIH